MNAGQYFKNLEKDVRKVYKVMEEARQKGLDPVDKVEVPLAKSMAEKVVALIGTIYPQLIGCGVDKRILELEKKYGKLDSTIAFMIAEEVAKQKFCKFESLLQAIDAGIRIGFAYITLGVVASPIEGFTELKLGKTREGKDYFIAYFSGPIRSAGTTASCVALMLIDYLRELFGYAKYDPTEEEVKRYVTENIDFHERVSNLQYFPTEDEMAFLAKNLPFQIAGEPTERIEVSNYKNLERVETDYIRGGMCLIFSEGLAQKAAKGLRLLNGAKKNGIKSTGFDWIPEYIKLHEKREKGVVDESPTYIQDLVAGRPVFGHPSRSGGFRFRYGLGRVSGFSAVSVHPATMAITDDFIATGTQLKVEKPIKGTITTVCDSIDGPIVKLVNGSVKKIKTKEEARKIYKNVDEIIYLGDILFAFSDVLNRNSVLLKPGYVEEWWGLELKKALLSVPQIVECGGKKTGGSVTPQVYTKEVQEPLRGPEKSSTKIFTKGNNYYDVSFDDAVKLSRKYKIPLHPEYIFYWTEISKEQFLGLVGWLKNSHVSEGKLVLPYNQVEKEEFALGKRALELLGVEHDVTIENVVVSEVNSNALLVNLGMNKLDELECNKFDLGGKEILEVVNEVPKEGTRTSNELLGGRSVLEVVNEVSEFVIKDKAGDFIGTRMGRPEKAKVRKLTGRPNVLFPIGKEGGRLRSVQAACQEGFVKSAFPIYHCKECNKETIYPCCEDCNKKCEKMYYFYKSKDKAFNKVKEDEEKEGTPYCTRSVDINHYFEDAVRKLGLTKEEIPLLIKGIRGTSSEDRVLENLAKGMLRAKHDLQVNKDGTIRFDATELPLISFKPKEISVGVEKLKELGYDKDIDGNDLVSDEQILELMPHDILLPSSPETPDERADDVFMKIANFIDELLVRFYGLKPFYNIKRREDLIGKLGVCMAPHNCAGVICRFIGFSNALGLFASPYMHAAIRRDCFDYDTYFPIKCGGVWKMVKIGDLVDKLNPKIVVDNYGTKEKKVVGFETIGFDNDLKSVKINNFTKHSKNSMFEIKTSLGKKIKVTENHKFLVAGKIKSASSLQIGDKLPLPRRIKIKSNDLKEVNLAELLGAEKLMVRKIGEIFLKLSDKEKEKILGDLKISKKQFMNYKLRDSYPIEFVLRLNEKLKKEVFRKGFLATKRDNIEVPIIVKLDKELLEVIGLYIAEGYARSVGGKKGLNQIYIASEDKSLREFVKKTIEKHFGLIPSERKEDRVTFSSRVLYLFFTKILECGSNAKSKRIPSLFFDLPLEKLSAVLRGYFEGDGSVSKSDKRISCDSVSDGLLYDLEFCLARFGIFAKRYEYEKQPGPRVREFYIRKKREIPNFRITKLTIGSDFVDSFKEIGFLSSRKKKVFDYIVKKSFSGMRIDYNENFVYDPIISIEGIGEKESYCLNVDTENHLVIGNSIVSAQCDGDEAAIMLLGDVLLNFSRKFLPSHRGGTQDAPLVLNAKIDAGEVDDQILDFEFVRGYPLELYEKAEERKHSSEVKGIKICKDVLREGGNPFVGIGFTHDTSNFNDGVVCSSYKIFPTMAEKVRHQMELVERIRAVDTSDTARLIIDRHFIRDMRGNLRKFSMQGFRCVACNEIMRRPPLNGVCSRCGGKLIFTIHEGGIKKYLEPALDLAKKYNLSPYMKQNLELVKRYIESIFGKELEKQKDLNEYF
ncbi:MAG: DNA polymerase II large subunit [Nanoarchaeota archaeon]|nr:DNA polymerase II large subunit [Nanoarchaeota archaeon]